jgi:putative tricarboxylic transport membrane protein
VADQQTTERALAQQPDAEPARTGAASARSRRSWRALALHLALPLALLAAALILPAFMLARPFRGPGLGPTVWPQFALALVGVCCLLWALQTAIAWHRGRLEAAPEARASLTEAYSYPKALSGLVLILTYGWSLPLIGFPIATTLFIALWCMLGGIRNPLAVVPISVIGTIVLLWVFMGLALMPLSRGRGVFDAISVAILRALGIY